MGCNCGSSKAAAPASLRWTVDLAPFADLKFADGSKKKTFLSVAEANAAVRELKAQGRVRPRPATAND